MSDGQDGTALAGKRCVPCEGGVPAIERPEALRLKASLHPDWQLGEDARALHRAFSFKDFYRTMSFVNAVAHVANIEDHHPDLEVGYNYCRIQFTTHAIRGLSENDFICAAKVDALPVI